MKYNYPEPRAPSYEEPTSVEDCIHKAKVISRKKGGRTAMGTIEKGDCILVLSLPDQDEYVTMDFFKFDDNGKICEHWDAIQQIPKVSKNLNTIY